jgi:hypothetical protein
MSQEKQPFCEPLNAGLASEPQAVGRRLAELFMALDRVNNWIVRGRITDALWEFRTKLRLDLEAEGWTVCYGDYNRCRVYVPGSKTGKRIRKARGELR